MLTGAALSVGDLAASVAVARVATRGHADDAAAEEERIDAAATTRPSAASLSELIVGNARLLQSAEELVTHSDHAPKS